VKHTLLFGNGLNLLGNNPVSWDLLLQKLEVGSNTVSKETPNTMKYEKIFLDRSSSNLRESMSEELPIKNQIAKLMKDQRGNKYYSEIIEMGFENYLTTNYDDAFCESYEGTSTNASTEGIYSLRRYLSLNSPNYKATKLWHIHGEIEHPKSIMLGLDHYCGSIAKIDAYLKGKYEYRVETKRHKTKPIVEKLVDNDFDRVSWVELFFNTDIHILGLSLDYSETDLWWVLNKRARLMLDNKVDNKIFYYDSNIPEDKKALLISMKVIVVEEIRRSDGSHDFLLAHNLLMKKLKENTAINNTLAT